MFIEFAQNQTHFAKPMILVMEIVSAVILDLNYSIKIAQSMLQIRIPTAKNLLTPLV